MGSDARASARTRVGAAQVRPARPEDVARVAEIERQSFGDPWSAASFAGLVGDPRVLFAVVETEAGVGGYSVVWTMVDESELANVAVAPELRGKGVGARLVDAAMAAAATRGAEVMYLEVRASNTVAQSLYASRGFVQVGRRRRYYRHPVEDALVMRAPIGAAGALVEDGARRG